MSAIAALEPRAAVESHAALHTARIQRLLFVGVLAIAATVRLWGLGRQPVPYFDSGVYLGEGAFLASAIQRALSGLVGSGDGSALQRIALATASGVDGHSPDIAKPGHAILLAIAFLLLGKTVLAGGLVSALSGIGTVAATYALALRRWGTRVALIAALLLAISGQHLVYSREPLVEADGLLFAMLASLLYLRATSARGLFAAGDLWGLAFRCNNRLSYVPAVFVIAELAHWPGWRGLVRRGVIVGVGCLAPLAVIEGAYLLVRAIGRAAGLSTEFLDYAQQLAAFTRMNPPDRLRFDEWPTYFVDVALRDGLAVLALLLVGIALIVWRLRSAARSREDLLLAGSLLVPLLLYSVYSTGEVRLRHFSLALPWAMLAAALALDWLAVQLTRLWRGGTSKSTPTWVVSAACGLLALLALPRIVALDAAVSGMPTVLAGLGTGPVAAKNTR